MSNQPLGIKIEMPMDRLRGHVLFIGTPMYGGQCLGTFTRSIADLTALCTLYGIKMHLDFLSNESLITRARNYVSDDFMRSGASHLMFIDADIGFNPQDVLALMALTIDNKEYGIIGAAYPKKTISWEKVRAAVNKGLVDPPTNPNELEKYVGDFVFNPKPGVSQIKLNEPTEVLEIGTGFMMITRDSMNKFREFHGPKYEYKPDHARSEHFDGSRKIYQYFQAEIDPKSERYLSEDYWFTQKAHEAGIKTFLCPWMPLNHTGSMTFSGTILDLAQANVSLTADAEELRKNRSGNQQDNQKNQKHDSKKRRK